MSEDTKQPSMQWYPKDWLGDPNVQSLDYEMQGIWFAILMQMWLSEERGKLTLNGLAMPIDAIARLLGLTVAKAEEAVGKLITYGVASSERESGKLYCRRMVKYKSLTQIRREAGIKGAKKRWDGKGDGKTENVDSKDMRKYDPPSSPPGEEGAAAALSATSEATPRSPENGRENGRENQSRKPEPEPEPEPKRIWPEEFHCDPEFWLEKLAEHADADKQVESAAMAAGLGYEDAILMQINFCSLKRKDEMTTPKMARAIADRCRSLIDSPRCQAERLEVVS